MSFLQAVSEVMVWTQTKSAFQILFLKVFWSLTNRILPHQFTPVTFSHTKQYNKKKWMLYGQPVKIK